MQARAASSAVISQFSAQTSLGFCRQDAACHFIVRHHRGRSHSIGNERAQVLRCPALAVALGPCSRQPSARAREFTAVLPGHQSFRRVSSWSRARCICLHEATRPGRCHGCGCAHGRPEKQTISRSAETHGTVGAAFDMKNHGFSLCEKWAGVLLEAKSNKTNGQVWCICMCSHRLMVDVVRARGKASEEPGGMVYKRWEKQNTPKEYYMLGLGEADNSAGKCSYRKNNLKACDERARCDRAKACLLMQRTTLWLLRSVLRRARPATLQALEGRRRHSEAMMHQDGDDNSCEGELQT